MPVNRSSRSRRPHPRTQRHGARRGTQRGIQKGQVNSRQAPTGHGNELLAALGAFALIAIMTVIGIFMFRPSGEQPKIDLLVAADVTGSVGTASRQKLFGILDETVDGVLPRGSEVKLWAYGLNAHEISEKSPRKSEDLWADEDKCIAYRPAIDTGTRPATVLKEMEPTIQGATARGENTGIMLLTDGEDTDYEKPETKILLEEVIKRIAADSHVKAVWFAGTSTEPFRSLLERRLRPLLGDRLVLSSNGDAQDGMNRFRALLTRK